MAQKNHVIALLLTIPADDYEEALDEADQIGESLSLDSGVGVEVIRDYEHDNEGQRVVYLPSEEGDESEDSEENDDEENEG